MASYDAEIRVKTSLENQTFKVEAKKLENSLAEIEKKAIGACEKLDALDKAGTPKTSQKYKNAQEELLRWSKALSNFVQQREEAMHRMERGWNPSKGDIDDDVDYKNLFASWQEASEKANAFQSQIGVYFADGSDKVRMSVAEIEKAIDAAKEKMESLKQIPKAPPELYQSAEKDLAKWTAELEAVKGKQQETTSDFSERINLMRVDIEEYANTLKQLEKEGKYFGDADYDKVYLAWKQATEEAKKYQAELNKHTDKGQAEETARAARELEKQEAIQRRIEAQVQKEAEKQAKLQAQTAEEQRLAGIKAQATVADQRIVSLLERRKQLQAEIADLEKAGVTAGYREYDAKQAELKSINNQVSGSADISGMIAQFAALAGKASKVLAVVGAVLTAVKKIASVIKMIAVTVGKIVGSLLKKMAIAFKFVAAQTGKLFSKLTSGFKSSSSSAGSFGDRLMGLVKSVFVFNVISKAFQSMVSGVQDSTKKFTQYSASFNGNISSLVNALNTLKNAIAGAFAPILSIAIPYLVQLINYVTMAVNAVAQLIAALTGASTWSKAVQQNKDYAASLDKVGGSAKKAVGALAKFDDLDVLQKNDSAGGGGAGAGNLWEEVPVSDTTKGLADKIKKLLALDDWSELGKMIAEKLTEMFMSIPWGKIQAAARKLGKQLGSLLNGILSDFRLWEELGYALAQGINTALIFLSNFLSQFDFEKIGNNIADGINTAIGNINWRLLAQTFIVGINGLIDLVYGFVTSIDLEKLAQKLGETLFTVLDNLNYERVAETIIKGIVKISDAVIAFVESIDFKTLANHIVDMMRRIIRSMELDAEGNELGDIWEKNGEAVGKLIQAFVETVGTLMSGFAANGSELGRQIAKWLSTALDQVDWEEVGQAIHNMLSGFLDMIIAFLEEMDWADVGNKIGEFLVELDWNSILEKVGEALKLAFVAVLEVAFGEDFREDLKGVHGILAKSIVKALTPDDGNEFEEIGRNVVKGFTRGIEDGFEEDNEPMLGKFTDLAANVRERLGIHSPSTVFAEIGSFLIEGLLLGIQEMWVSLQEWFTTTFDNLILFFTEKWTLIKDGALEIWNGLKDSLAETWENIRESVIEKFDAVKEKFEEVWNAVKECIDLKVKNIKDKVKELNDKFTELKNDVSTAFTNIKNSIINALSPVIDKLKDFIQWVKDAIQAVKDFFSSGYDQVGSTAGKTSKTTTARSVMAASPASISAAMADIPHLASGAVLRGGNPFLAVLNEQSAGQTNVEAPLSTIRQGLREELSALGFGSGGGQAKITINLNGQDVGEAIIEDLLSVMNRKGYDVEVLGVT